MLALVREASWAALTDPNRRALLELLRDRPRAVGELVGELGLTQPATSKHLRVLREAGLVRARPHAQQRLYELEPAPFEQLNRWVSTFHVLWEKRLDNLDDYLQQIKKQGQR